LTAVFKSLSHGKLHAVSATASLAYDEAARFAALALDAAETGATGPGAGGGLGGGGLGLRAELTLDAARAEFAAGCIEASVARCQAAARLAGEADRPDIAAASALVITGMGDPATNAAVDALCASAIRAVPAGDTTLRARLLARQAIFAAETGACHQARELSAESLVTEAAAEFRRLDLPGPLATADALLAGIDAAARAASPLSPRESEIAALIASAMSNRQIAQQLALSERTVETHVRSILAKLGFSSRTEIATWSLRATRLGSARAEPRLPLRAGDPVHHPVAAILGDRADVRPAGPLEDGPHGYVGGIGRRVDGPGRRRGRTTSRSAGRAPPVRGPGPGPGLSCWSTWSL
jgi:DNA-binding NarL/FixJ family response regulator